MPLTTVLGSSPSAPSEAEMKSLQEGTSQPLGDDFFNFTWAKTRFDKIISDWDVIKKETERYRLLRYIKADKVTLQSLNLFKTDETYIAIRLIDQNIRAEQPQRLAYITQPRRSVVLKPMYGVSVNGLENVETVFTDCARYTGWETPFIKVDDGASTHGWDYVEIVFDPSKPGHFAVEHVGHENLMFDLEAEDIYAQGVLGRVLKRTSSQFALDVENDGFNPTHVNEVVETDPKNESKTKDTTYTIYKFFFINTKDKAVYVCYYGGEKTTGWLREPKPLYLGVDDVKNPAGVDPTGKPIFPRLAETAYPYYQLDYMETESPKIVDKRGRAYLDEPAQEGASMLQSAIVNGTARASNVYGCVKQGPVPSTDNAAPKQTDIKIQHGMVYDKEMTFFNTPWPPDSAGRALEMITSFNRLDISRPDYAVKNRQDSRKTATEVQASVNDTAQQASVQSTQQSVFMRKVYTKCYEIFSNRVISGAIPIVDPSIKALVSIPVDVKAAGDVDVIQRQEKLARQMQAWPVVSNTAIAIPFLKDMLVNMFPEEAPKYIQALGEDQMAKQLVAGLASALQVAVTDDSGGLKPEFAHEAPQLQALAGQVQQFITGGTPEGEQQNGPQPAQAA